MNNIEEAYKKLVPERVREVLFKLIPGKSVVPEGQVDTSESRRNGIKKMGFGVLVVGMLPGEIVKAITEILESLSEPQDGVKKVFGTSENLEGESVIPKQKIQTEFVKIETMVKRNNLGNFFEEISRTLDLKKQYLESYMRSPFGKKSEYNKTESSRAGEWIDTAIKDQKIEEELKVLIQELEVLEKMIRNSEDLNWKFVPHKNYNASTNEASRLNLLQKKEEQAVIWKNRVQKIENILSEWTDMSFEKYKEEFSLWKDQEEKKIQGYRDKLEKGIYTDNEDGISKKEDEIKNREILYEKYGKRKKITKEKREEQVANIAIMKAEIVGYNNLPKKDQKLKMIKQRIKRIEINISEREAFIEFRQDILNQLEKIKNNIPMGEFTRVCNEIKKHLSTFQN